jgi:hypothetical protein
LAGNSRALQWQIRPKLCGWDHVAPLWAGGVFANPGVGHGGASGALAMSGDGPWRAAEPAADWKDAIAALADEIQAEAAAGPANPDGIEGLLRSALARLTGARPARLRYLSEQILLWHLLCLAPTARRRTMAAICQHGAALLRAG